jgi:signal transduction histidine kinase
LTILKTHLEGFEDGVLTMSPEEIKTCQAQVESISAMIVGMSAIIDAEKDLDDIQVEEIEVVHLLKQIVGALNVQFDKKQIRLSLRSDKKVLIKSDKSKLSQIIYNILTNAYKYTEPNGEVSVTCEVDSSGIVIKIEDTGPGIGEKDLEHLFDAYYRGANAVNVPGEGIGLYVVKENLGRLNGKIDVESEIGRGSRFIISIPYHM